MSIFYNNTGISMEGETKPCKLYEGKGDPPEGVGKLNLGDKYYHCLNHIKILEFLEADGGLSDVVNIFKPAFDVSKNRQQALMKSYEPRFQIRNIEPHGLIGKGAFGKVWKVKFPRTEYVALKQVDFAVKPDQLWKERDVLVLLKHKRVVNLIGAFVDGAMYFVFELCMFNLNLTIKNLKEHNQLRYTIQFVEAIAWIHSKNVVHCDLKADNLLITSSNNLVVSDFGAALLLDNVSILSLCHGPAKIAPDKDVIKCERSRGLFGYQDLESNRDFTYCKSSDIFSMGCLLFEIWAGKYLLRYSCNFENSVEREIQEYIKALQNGRICKINLFNYPYDGATRVKLSVRINNACPRWFILINFMTELRRQDRKIADYFVQCGAIKTMRDRLVQISFKVDNDNIVNTNVAMSDSTEELITQSSAVAVQNSAFAGIYYDEFDTTVQDTNPMLGKSLLSYETHVIANFVLRHGLDKLIFPALASGDPSMLGAMQMRILKEMVSGLVGLNQRFPEPASKREVETQTEEVEAGVRSSNVFPAVHWQESEADQETIFLDGSAIDSSITHRLTKMPETNNLSAVETEIDSQDVTTIPKSHAHNGQLLADPFPQMQNNGIESSAPVFAPANTAHFDGAPPFAPREQFNLPPPFLSRTDQFSSFCPPNQTASVAQADIVSRPTVDTEGTRQLQQVNPENPRQRPTNQLNFAAKTAAIKKRNILRLRRILRLTSSSAAAIDPAFALVKPTLTVGQLAIPPVRQPDAGSNTTFSIPAKRERAPLDEDNKIKPYRGVASTSNRDGKKKSQKTDVDLANNGKATKTDRQTPESVKLVEDNQKGKKQRDEKKEKRQDDQEKDGNDESGEKKQSQLKEPGKESKAKKRGHDSTHERIKTGKRRKASHKTDAHVEDSGSEHDEPNPPFFTHECPLCNKKFSSEESCRNHIDIECEVYKERKELKRKNKAMKKKDRKKQGK